MMKIFVAVLLLITGVIAKDICDDPPQERCPIENAPDAFPETEEEFKNVCSFAIDLLECGIQYEEKCNPNGLVKERASDFLTVFQDMCDEDTLLYAAIVENLKCFASMEKEGFINECERESMSPSGDEFIESLVEDGLLALTDDEMERHNERSCISEMISMACLGTKIENKCGTLAMDTYVELLQKFMTVTPCERRIHLLPEIIRIYKLREEEANEISNILKKRK